MTHQAHKTTSGRHRKAGRIRHPYAWLGAGAVTVGIGAALASGTAVAAADTGASDSGAGSSSASSAKPAAAGAHSRSQSRTTAATATSSNTVAAGSARTASTAAPTSTLTAQSNTTPAMRVSHAVLAAPEPASAADATAADTAHPNGFGDKSYLPPNQVIVPGSAVTMALQQIAAAQNALQAQTWGTGNILAGLVSLVPQALLAQSASSLTAWQNNIEGAKTAVANTVNIPVVHELAELSLVGTLLLPTMAGITLDAAAATTPLLGLVGASTAATEASALIGTAKQNSQVYSVHLMRTINTTQQIVYLSVNGGPVVPVLLDTGSTGLSIINQYVGQENLGPPIGTGTSGYGDSTVGVTYSYTTYQTTIDFGNGAVTAPVPVNIVDATSQAGYENYGHASAGFVGVLGIGANSGEGITPNALLPGELKDGVTVYQDILGPFGLVVFGPNPLPSRGSVSGTPIGDFQVKINDGPQIPTRGFIDSGGVNGSYPTSIVGGAVNADGSGLKPGTRISVYSADGLTLLYTYTITDSNSPTVYVDGAQGSAPNTGNIPFQLGPIYLGYGTPGGLGTTYFDIV